MIFAPSGWGKSRLLGRRICYQDALRGKGQIIIDRVGGTINNFLDKVLYLPREKQIEVGKRIVYCNMAGQDEFICPFPMLYRWRDTERIEQTAERIVKLLSRIDVKFDNAAIYGLKRAEPLLRSVCQVLVANRLPIFLAEDILEDPLVFTPLLQKAMHHPQAKAGALKLIKHSKLPAKEREARTEPLRNRLSILTQDTVSRGMFSAQRAPLVDWEKVASAGQTVLIDLSGKDLETAHLMKLFWVWNLVLECIESRESRGHTLPPLGVVIDELSTFVADESLNREKIITDFRKIVFERKRNANIWLTAATQEQSALPQELLSACLTLGSLMFGATVNQYTARALSERFDPIDPYKVKDTRLTYGFKPSSMGASNRDFSYYTVTGEQKTFFPFDEQVKMNSVKYMDIPKEDWFMARARFEGHVPRHLTRITTRGLDPGQFINNQMVGELKTRLMAQSGVKVEEAVLELEEAKPPDHAPNDPEQTSTTPTDTEKRPKSKIGRKWEKITKAL